MIAVLPPGELAAMIEAAADWAEDELAGGTNPKPVAWWLVTAARGWAAAARGKAALPQLHATLALAAAAQAVVDQRATPDEATKIQNITNDRINKRREQELAAAIKTAAAKWADAEAARGKAALP